MFAEYKVINIQRDKETPSHGTETGQGHVAIGNYSYIHVIKI